MRPILLGIFLLASLSGHAQTASATSSAVASTATSGSTLAPQPEAAKKLRKLKGSIHKRAEELLFKNQEKVSQLMAEATDEFIRIASSEHTEDEYLKSIDNSFALLTPFTRAPDDREEVAKYYQELMDIVGLKTSEGRLNAFVTRPRVKP